MASGTILDAWQIENRRSRATERASACADEDVETALWEELVACFVNGEQVKSRSLRWRSVAVMVDFLRQHSAGGRGTAFGKLLRRDQVLVVTRLLNAFVRAGNAERAKGPGERGRECWQYAALPRSAAASDVVLNQCRCDA